MIDLDNGPLALFMVICVAYTCPIVYSFLVDNYDKKNPQILDK